MKNKFNRENVYLITVDGLDVSGKETFSKSLHKVLERELMDRFLFNTKISRVSFPRYHTEIGVKIKNLLNVDVEKRDIKLLYNLMEQDRIDFFKKYMEEEYEENQVNIIICDRYAYANYIYAHLELLKYNDPVEIAVKELEFKRMLLNEFENIPKPELTILFNRTDSISTSKHQELIKAKSEKDSNEKEEIQSFLSSQLSGDILDTIAETTDELIVVPIGSNFDSDRLETAIAMKVATKIVSAGYDNIIYPNIKIIKNNKTSKRIGHKKITPSVEIKFSGSLKRSAYSEYSSYIKDIIKTYNMLITSEIERPTYNSPYDLLMRSIKEYAPKTIYVDNELIEEYLLPYLPKYDESYKTLNIEEIIDEKNISKLLLTPRKTSPLDSTYNIFTSDIIHLKENEIKEVPLNVLIESIEGLVRETKYAILDIDIRTSRDCILKYGVSIADSPSTLSCDFNGMLSVVLINNTNKPVLIPIGAKLASLLIKRSSCETNFIMK